jgi:hypothetical protein
MAWLGVVELDREVGLGVAVDIDDLTDRSPERVCN